MHGEGKINSNSNFNFNFNFGIENEIVLCMIMCEIKWIMLIIYHLQILI
jgi:hypothetical protein